MKWMPVLGRLNFAALMAAVAFDSALRLWRAAHPPAHVLSTWEYPTAEDCLDCNALSTVDEAIDLGRAHAALGPEDE
jgi:hypothetical protein